MNDVPQPPVSPQAVLDALQRSGSALAWVDADGKLRWCSAAFAALGDAAAAALIKTSATAIDITAPGPDGAPAPWRLRLTAAGDAGRWVSAEPLAELHATQLHAARLQERLDLVQDFSDTGVFERDAVTLQGTWDHHMYRIWGLPERPAPALAPSFAETSDMIFSGDRRQGAFRATLSQPGLHTQRTRIHRPDGQVRHLHTKWQVSHDGQGAARRVLGINTDDTEACERTHRAEIGRASCRERV